MDFLSSMMTLKYQPVVDADNEYMKIINKLLIAKESLCAKYRELLGVSGEYRIRSFLKDIAINWDEQHQDYIDDCNGIMIAGVHHISEWAVNFDSLPSSSELTILLTILSFVGKKAYIAEINQISRTLGSNSMLIMMYSAPLPPEIPLEEEGVLNVDSESLLREMRDRYFSLFPKYIKARHLATYITKLQWQVEAMALLPSNPLNEQVKNLMIERKEQLMEILRELSSNA